MEQVAVKLSAPKPAALCDFPSPSAPYLADTLGATLTKYISLEKEPHIQKNDATSSFRSSETVYISKTS